MKSKIEKELNSVCKKIMDLQKKIGCDPGDKNVAQSILKTYNANSQRWFDF